MTEHTSSSKELAVLMSSVRASDAKTLMRIFAISKGRTLSYRLVEPRAGAQCDILILEFGATGSPEALQAAVQSCGAAATCEIADPHQAARGSHTLIRPLTATRVLGALDRIGRTLTPRTDAGNGARHAPMDATPPGGQRAQQTRHARALVVDDSQLVRTQVGKALKRYGIEAEFAEGGQTALELVARSPFDIIFLDLVMPGMDGYKVCKAIKHDKTRRHLPVVMLTSRSSPIDKIKAKLCGCDSYLTKPVSLSAFHQTVSRLLAKRRVEIAPIS